MNVRLNFEEMKRIYVEIDELKTNLNNNILAIMGSLDGIKDMLGNGTHIGYNIGQYKEAIDVTKMNLTEKLEVAKQYLYDKITVYQAINTLSVDHLKSIENELDSITVEGV